jgi:outer membrane protein assembly factor BamB
VPSAVIALLLSVLVADWPLFGREAGRSSAFDRGAKAAAAPDLRVRWHLRLDAVADNAPIVADGRVFVTSRNGTTTAVDSASGHVLWKFATRGPNITTSVPAYDLSDGSLYAGGVDGQVHVLDPANGHERKRPGFPARVTLAPETEKLASPLNLSGGYLYAQTSGYIGDGTPYVGHVVAIRLSDGATRVFDTLCARRRRLIDPATCPAQRSGLWSRAGVVVDPDPAMRGRIYVATGNGPFDPRSGNYGDSVLALDAAAATLEGFLTPKNYAYVERRDLDVGTSAPALLPRQRDRATPLLAVHAGKDGVLSLFDRARLAGLGRPLQEIQIGGALYSAPAVWTDPHGITRVILGLADGVHAYRLVRERDGVRLAADWSTEVSLGLEGTSPIVVDDVVYVAANARLVALDAEHGNRLGSNDTLGLIHWESPSYGDGAVYCSDENGYLTAFEVASSR